jgi:uncharacterized protein
MSGFTADGNTVSFWLRVRPRSRHQHLLRTASDDLCLELTAPPVEGQANEAAVDFFARSLRMPRSSVEIVAGAKSRRKLFRITARSAREIIARLEALAQEKGR